LVEEIKPMERSLLMQINKQQHRFGKAKPTEKSEEKKRIMPYL